MAKAGVLALTQSLAVEWGPKGIRTVAISPGTFPTKGAWDRLVPASMAKRWESASPVGRSGEHSELANLAAYLVLIRPATSTAIASPSMVAAGCKARAYSRSYQA